jgi:hypothetical protein
MVQFTVTQLNSLQRKNKSDLKEALRQVEIRRQNIAFTSKQITKRKREDRRKK